MVTMAQSAAKWRNTHTHADHTHLLTLTSKAFPDFLFSGLEKAVLNFHSFSDCMFSDPEKAVP